MQDIEYVCGCGEGLRSLAVAEQRSHMSRAPPLVAPWRQTRWLSRSARDTATAPMIAIRLRRWSSLNRGDEMTPSAYYPSTALLLVYALLQHTLGIGLNTNTDSTRQTQTKPRLAVLDKERLSEFSNIDGGPLWLPQGDRAHSESRKRNRARGRAGIEFAPPIRTIEKSEQNSRQRGSSPLAFAH